MPSSNQRSTFLVTLVARLAFVVDLEQGFDRPVAFVAVQPFEVF